ncbi:MAG TPA: hypothetical protein VLL30_03275, partial [Reyranella sp.]|nr:hypothetical protein [Reyranella sp.]
MAPVFEPMTGRYLRLEIEGIPHRVYFEEAGQGIPLVCLHTAGADGRQYRHLLADPEITRRFRVLAFDMPWHGKSTPPDGWQAGEYRLTTAPTRPPSVPSAVPWSSTGRSSWAVRSAGASCSI